MNYAVFAPPASHSFTLTAEVVCQEVSKAHGSTTTEETVVMNVNLTGAHFNI